MSISNELYEETMEKIARELSYQARENLPKSEFVYKKYPKTGEPAFPIQDKPHARNALARAHYAPDPEKVKRAVYSKYPELKD